MNNATKVGAYLAGLAVVFAAALGVGNAVGPVGQAPDPTQLPAQTSVGHRGMQTSDDAGG